MIAASRLAEACERARCSPLVAREIVRWCAELTERERVALFRAVRGELRGARDWYPSSGIVAVAQAGETVKAVV